MSDKKKVKKVIVSKLRQMNGKVKLSFKDKTSVLVSKQEADSFKKGDDYNATSEKEEK